MKHYLIIQTLTVLLLLLSVLLIFIGGVELVAAPTTLTNNHLQEGSQIWNI